MSETAPETDSFDTEVEAARAAEHEAPENDRAAVIEPLEDDAAPSERQQPAARTPLTAEQLTERDRQSRTALKQERQARQALQAQIDELKAAMKPKADARTPDQTPPDPTVDPIGALQHLQKRLAGFDNETAAERQQRENGERQQAELTRLRDWGKEQEDDFRDEHPDYDKAAQHFIQARAKELLDEGHSQGDLQGQITQELAALMRRAQAGNRNPAELIYKMAQNRGFGKSPSAAAEALDKVKAGQDASRSLSSTGGRPAASGTLTMGKVADLKGAAFDQAFEKLRAAQKRA